jgi:hypothetical protein
MTCCSGYIIIPLDCTKMAVNLLLRHDCFGVFFYMSTSDASVATGGMSDKDKEHARIMARLDELEMEEREAGSTSEEEDDDDGGAGTSEDGEENEESGNALSDGNEHQSSSFGTSFSRNGGDDDDDEDDGGAGTSEDDEGNEVSGNALSDGNDHPSSSFGTSFSGNDGHDRSHGNIQVHVSQTDLTYERLVHVLELFILIL